MPGLVRVQRLEPKAPGRAFSVLSRNIAVPHPGALSIPVGALSARLKAAEKIVRSSPIAAEWPIRNIVEEYNSGESAKRTFPHIPVCADLTCVATMKWCFAGCGMSSRSDDERRLDRLHYG